MSEAELYMPSKCPNPQDSKTDLHTALFELVYETGAVHEGVDGPSVYGAFLVKEGDDPSADVVSAVYTETLEVAPGSMLQAILEQPVGSAGEDIAPAVRDLLCARIAECSGALPDGACCALSVDGLRSAIERASGVSLAE